MNDSSKSTERKCNIWAPWRMEYIESLSQKDKGCFLCRYRDDPQNDRENLILWRGENVFAIINRFPYTGGHCLVAPCQHVGQLSDLDSKTITELMEMLRDLQAALEKALCAEGFNIGINIGRCAGAGLPEHLHAHIVPRWSGDTNFMPVFGDVRVIPEFLTTTYDRIIQATKQLGLDKRYRLAEE